MLQLKAANRPCINVRPLDHAMRNTIKNVLMTSLLLGNLVVGIGLAFLSWLAAAWMIDDALAAQLTPVGWIGIAFKRAAIGLFVALVIGFLFAIINRRAFASVFPDRGRPHWLVAGVTGWLSALGTIAGCVQFVIQKPYI